MHWLTTSRACEVARVGHSYSLTLRDPLCDSRNRSDATNEIERNARPPHRVCQICWVVSDVIYQPRASLLDCLLELCVRKDALHSGARGK